MYLKYYKIGGFTIELNSEIRFKPDTFHPKFKKFEVDEPIGKKIVVNHYFNKTVTTEVSERDIIYSKKPWVIYNKKNRIIYKWVGGDSLYGEIITNNDHTRLDIYNTDSQKMEFERGGVQNITLLSTDQILLSRILGFHQGCLLHSTALIYKNNGYIFLGHSGAGKTTIANIMKQNATILCDDRNIIQNIDGKYRLYGTWRHSNLAEISALSAPLKGIFFLIQSKNTKMELINDRKKRFFLTMEHLVRSLVTQDWMEATFDLVESLSKEIDFFNLKFNTSGDLANLMDDL